MEYGTRRKKSSRKDSSDTDRSTIDNILDPSFASSMGDHLPINMTDSVERPRHPKPGTNA